MNDSIIVEYTFILQSTQIPTLQSEGQPSLQPRDDLHTASLPPVSSTPSLSDGHFSLMNFNRHSHQWGGGGGDWSVLPYNPQRESIQICLFGQREAQPNVVSTCDKLFLLCLEMADIQFIDLEE